MTAQGRIPPPSSPPTMGSRSPAGGLRQSAGQSTIAHWPADDEDPDFFAKIRSTLTSHAGRKRISRVTERKRMPRGQTAGARTRLALADSGETGRHIFYSSAAAITSSWLQLPRRWEGRRSGLPLHRLPALPRQGPRLDRLRTVPSFRTRLALRADRRSSTLTAAHGRSRRARVRGPI